MVGFNSTERFVKGHDFSRAAKPAC